MLEQALFYAGRYDMQLPDGTSSYQISDLQVHVDETPRDHCDTIDKGMHG